MELLIATANPGKVREFADMLSGDDLHCTGLKDHAELQEVAETGLTFRANACLKAAGYASQAGRWALADDSGLEVDALNGYPGVYSARWAKRHNQGEGDEANNHLLLEQMEKVADPRRAARFVCVLALSDPQGRILLTVRDTMEGMLLREPHGSNGFGYDPLLYLPSERAASAQLPSDRKHQISHRGKALRRMRQLMRQVQWESHR